MDQVTKVRKYLKREQWLALISDCQSSGMTVTAQSDKPAVFKQLQLQQPVSDGKAAVLIHLPYATLEVHNGAGRETLEAALAALKSTC